MNTFKILMESGPPKKILHNFCFIINIKQICIKFRAIISLDIKVSYISKLTETDNKV